MGYEGVKKKSAFSEKVAMAPENRYDGERKGAQWRLNVRPYLISRAPNIARVLHYVEEHEDQSALVEDLLPRVGLPKSILMQLALDVGFSDPQPTGHGQDLGEQFQNDGRVRTVAQSNEERALEE